MKWRLDQVEWSSPPISAAGRVVNWRIIQMQLLYSTDLHYRQPVHIEGSVKKLSDEELTKYFHSRPCDSQVSACVSKQSSVIDNKSVLKREHQCLQETYADENVTIPKPPHWGGYVIEPACFEFWQEHSDRLHDRIVFIRQDLTWIVKLLAPFKARHSHNNVCILYAKQITLGVKQHCK